MQSSQVVLAGVEVDLAEVVVGGCRPPEQTDSCSCRKVETQARIPTHASSESAIGRKSGLKRSETVPRLLQTVSVQLDASF